MAKTITRQNLKLFGKDGASSNFGQFGSQAASAPVNTKVIATIQGLAAWLGGLQEAVAAGNAPYLQDVNSLFYVFGYQLASILQDGVPDWQTDTLYYIGSLVRRVSTSEIYMSKTDDNTANALPTAGTSDSNWQFVSGVIGGVFRISGALAMNSAKVTGLAAATTSGDALRYEQLFGGTVTLTDNLIFSPTTKGVKGTTTNDDAAALNVGEYVTAYNSLSSNITTLANVTTISLTAGDWDVTGAMMFRDGATLPAQGVLSLFSGATTTDQESGTNEIVWTVAGSDSIRNEFTLPTWRLSLASTTTVYLKALCASPGSRVIARLRARRMR